LGEPIRAIYDFIEEHNEYSVAKWVRFFGVSRSGYYGYIKRKAERERKKDELKREIQKIFEEGRGAYGSDRICGILRKNGKKATYRKVSRYMAEMGLYSIHNRYKSKSLTDSRKSRGDGYPNLLKGNKIEKSCQLLCSDITYLKSGEGWLYLCVVKDIASREVLGYAIDRHMRTELVICALLNAHHRYPLNGAIFHSDRGSQYTSKKFMKLLRTYGIRQSFSRVGVPGDNAWAESFFATLKKEYLHHNIFAKREELEDAVISWIRFYNVQRIQANLGYMSPQEYIAEFTAVRGTEVLTTK